MSEPLGSAVLRLTGDDQALLESITKAKAASSGLKDHFRKTASVIADAMALVGVGLSFNAIIEATVAAEREQALLAASVRATGGAAGFTAAQLLAQSAALQSLTGVSDEAIQAAERSLMSFRSVQGGVFKDALRLSLDLSVAMGTDAAGAARTLGMALADPATGMDRLKRSGIMLSDSTRQLITKLSAQGKVMEAQAAILAEVEKSYGGLAEAARDTLGGALANLKNVFEDNVLEMNGPFLSAMRQTVEILATAVPQAVRFAGAVFASLNAILGGVLSAVAQAAMAFAQFLDHDYAGAVRNARFAIEDLKLSASGFGPAFAQAWDEIGRSQAEAAAKTAALAAEVGKATGKYTEMGEEARKAAEKAAAAALKMRGVIYGTADDAVASADAANKAVDAMRSGQSAALSGTYDELAAKAEEFRALSNIAAENAMAAAEQAANTGSAIAAQSAENFKAVAASNAENAKRYAEAASAANARVAASMEALKVASASSAGGLVADFAKGKMAVEQFVQQAIILIAKLIVQMLILKAVAAGMMSAGGGGFLSGLAGGLLGGARAEGGPVSAGGAYLVGERGPELFVPDRSGIIMTAEQTAAAGGRGASVTVNATIQGADFGDDAVVRRVLEGVTRAVRSGVSEGLDAAGALSDAMTLSARRQPA